MTTEKDVQRVTTEPVARMLFALKNNGLSRLCVEFQKLSSVTIRDLYPLLHMAEFIDSLGEEGSVGST